MVDLSTSKISLAVRTTMILRHFRQKILSISASVSVWERTHANVLVLAKLSHHLLLLSWVIRKTKVPTVSIRNSEFFPVLGKTVPQATMTSTPTTSLTLLYQIPPIPGRKHSINPMTQPLLKHLPAHKTIAPLTTIARHAASGLITQVV